MRALLIDDEELALDYLEYQLNLIGDIEILGKYTDPLQGKEAVKELDAEIVFLDIHIPVFNGLELAQSLLEHNPHLHVVFVTTYDKYAIKAFELNALDYVLKPVQLERLKLTLQRTRQLLNKPESSPDIAAKWRIQTFGEFMVIDENNQTNERLNWRTKKAQELFYYLLHHRGKTVSKEKLIELLWPDFELKNASSQLYITVYHIRKTLERFGDRMLLHHTPDGYGLKLDNIHMDMNEFDQFLKSDRMLESETVSEYERILNLFQGEYLAEADYVWAENDRQRFQMQWIQLKLDLVNWLYEREQYEKAFKHCDQVCSRYPSEEEAHFMYMKICDRLGHHLLVRKQYKLLEMLMNIEFNEKPGARVSQWYERWKKENFME